MDRSAPDTTTATRGQNGNGDAKQVPVTGKDGWLGGHGLQWALTVLQGAVAVSLFAVAAVVLVRTVVTFLAHPGDYPTSLVSTLDGILVVIILIDILHTVVTHLHDTHLPLRPFLVIGILTAIRGILSASARLELTGYQSAQSFYQPIVQLTVSVGVVLALLVGLMVLRRAGPPGDDDLGA